ncbi:hypothetical protein CC78DRAFT_538568 [Lojkania enalia]|uniref:Helix-turn-helix domain-containing protein n=1 Tax=Lojkania enalia TaxID=147567 RepID=A0A9P4NCR1_9PLEO|nr:hypothetical protein CC78DRAFT_538568 [Didymosphaeria enalia]
MGSSASKTSRAAGAAARKYPNRVPNATTRPGASPPPQPSQPGPTSHSPPQASELKTEAIDLDARDPAFASRLNTIGAVQPNPHYSPSSISSFDPQRNTPTTLPSDEFSALPQSAFPNPRDNPAVRVLEARQRIAAEAEDELANVGRQGFKGRKYVDASVIQLALMRKQGGEPVERIEHALGIKKGRLGVLGKGIVEPIHGI